ncbi:hypothetical protein [Streptomyces sp. NPDC018055]|uniref:hypothetical protein n=1 Tax=Streptomyces sp. NPDC018055 TaxID=3365038 RepID=UPI0037AF30C6
MGTDEERMYRISDEHYFDWADLDDLVPKKPEVPDELQPFFPTGETVGEPGELYVVGMGGKPEFASGDEAVAATPEEMAQWVAVWDGMKQAQKALRARVKAAREAYEAATEDALEELATAMRPWAPIEATLKERTAELATTLHSHRTAAKEWQVAQEEKKQEHLDAVEGPRVVVLYEPNNLSSRKKTDHVAKVHLVNCKRRQTKTDGSMSAGLRAGDAWKLLNSPHEWIRGLWTGDDARMQVKFCSFCRPWTEFQERVKDFPRPRLDLCDGRMTPLLGPVRMTEIPDNWGP